MISRTEYIRLKKNKKKQKIIWTIILILSLIGIIFSLFFIFNWHQDNQNIEKLNDEINEKAEVVERPPENEENTENVNPPEDEKDDYWDYIKMDMLSVNFDELKKINSDTVAFIKVNGTNVNYPVVQTTNNDYYLTHAFDKSRNDAGWVFADYRNDMVNFGKNTIIYGHSRVNQTVFGSLLKVLNKSWYSNKDNHVIKMSTPTENTLWQIFSIYVIEPESYYLKEEFADGEFAEFINTLKSRSQIEFNTTVNENDKILTLSTCSDVQGTHRLAVHAKLIKIEKK